VYQEAWEERRPDGSRTSLEKSEEWRNDLFEIKVKAAPEEETGGRGMDEQERKNR
jgi:hypothetical protein